MAGAPRVAAETLLDPKKVKDLMEIHLLAICDLMSRAKQEGDMDVSFQINPLESDKQSFAISMLKVTKTY